MASDAWQQIRTAVAGIWHGAHPGKEKYIATQLEETREELIRAREAQDTDTEKALVSNWQLQLQRLLQQGPGYEGELLEVLNRVILPVLNEAERARVISVAQKAEASGSARIYQAGGNQNIYER